MLFLETMLRDGLGFRTDIALFELQIDGGSNLLAFHCLMEARKNIYYVHTAEALLYLLNTAVLYLLNNY